MWGAQLSCLDDRTRVAFRGELFYHNLCAFLSGSFSALLAYVSWGTTCMSFWQRTVVEKMPRRSHLGLFFHQTPK